MFLQIVLHLIFILRFAQCFSPSVAATNNGEKVLRHGAAVRSPNNDNGEPNANRKKPKREHTLYDILGASPTDSAKKLKFRYTELVKTLHPDALQSTAGNTVGGYELAEINAAWQVLSDPKAKLRYDRELKAKEFSDSVEKMVEVGFKTAIPFLQKTADTAQQTARESSRAFNRSAEQAKRAYDIFELEKKSRQLEQQASMEMSRANKLQEAMKNLHEKRLVQNLNEAQLTSTEAQRILKTFQVKDLPQQLMKDIDVLGAVKQEQKGSSRTQQATERASRTAEQKLDAAVQAEQMAEKRLMEAQQALQEAQRNHKAALQFKTEAVQQEKTAVQELDKVLSAQQRAREKVRSGLLQQQAKYLDRCETSATDEIKLLQQSAAKLREQAKELKAEAKRLGRNR